MERKHAISDLVLEQYVLGELTPEMEERVREELARDPLLQARYEEIKASDKEILDRYPPSHHDTGVIDRERRGVRGKNPSADSHDNPGVASSLEPVGRWALQLAIGLPGVALVLIILSFLFVRERATPDLRAKGLTPHLNALLKTPQGGRELATGSLVDRGDVIQLSYTAAGVRYGVILSVDGRGRITWHMPRGFPESSRMSPALDERGRVMLPVECELDDADFERFFFVYAEKPFDIAVVADSAHELAAKAGLAENNDLTLPAAVGQSAFLLKERWPDP